MSYRSTSTPWVAIAIIFILLVALTPLFLTSPKNDPSIDAKQEANTLYDFKQPYGEYILNKEVVKVGVYILSVGNLDTRTGTYAMDLFLNFKCATPPCDPTQFDIMNAASRQVDDQTEDSVRGSEYYYRIRANLQTNLDLKNYPFDRHTLIIEVEDKNKNNDEYVFVPEPRLSGIDPQVYVAGWSLEPYIAGMETSHEYKVYDEAYSRVRFAIHIYHPWFSSFMKGLFAAIVIVGVGMLSYLMKPSDAKDRIGLTSGTLAGAIFYHMTLTSSIPPVGYLTYADRFMILQYIFITASLGVAISLFLMQSADENEEKIQRIHRATRWVIPGLWVVSMVVLHITTLG